MARVRGPYSAAFPVNFTSKGDTTRDAFKKHMDEISRIYGILTDFDKDVANTEGITGELTKHINSTTPHPNYKPSISWSDLTGKPGLDDLSGTLSASKVKGELTNATIASGKVTGLEAFVKEKIPASSGDGIISKNFATNGYVKFNNGLIIQWGKIEITKQEYNSAREIPHNANFPLSFPTMCFTVIAGTGIEINDSNASDANVMMQVKDITKTGFKYIGQLFTVGDNVADKNFCHYIAIGY